MENILVRNKDLLFVFNKLNKKKQNQLIHLFDPVYVGRYGSRVGRNTTGFT